MRLFRKKRDTNINKYYTDEDINSFYINNLKKELTDYAIIKDNGDKVTAYLPLELLFIEDLKNIERKFPDLPPIKIKQLKVWEDQHISKFLPHRNLFYFFKGLSNDFNSYVLWYRECHETMGIKVTLTDEEIIDKRYKQYQYMTKMLNKGIEYFTDNPISAVWNENGYFNIEDGHHRTMFLYTSGIRLIPCTMTKVDYKKFQNKKVAKKIHNEILNQKRKEFIAPILNPFFYNLITYRDACFKNRLDFIFEYFNEYRFKSHTILEINPGTSYFSQAFAREKASITTLEENYQDYCLAKLTNQAFPYKSTVLLNISLKNARFKEEFDIAILLNNFFKKEKDVIDYLDKLNQSVNKLIIGEFDIQTSKKYIKLITGESKFKNYRKLSNTFTHNSLQEFGIFFTDEMKNIIKK